MGGCGNRSAQAPTPPEYRWPEQLAYRVDPAGAPGRTIRLAVRNLQYDGRWDTLEFFVSLGRRGDLSGFSLACDPAVPACQAVLPSRLLVALRRIVPRLPLFPAPRGTSWEDTLALDDGARPGGLRGRWIARYTGRGDTIVGGRAYWLLDWRARGENGIVLVDKGRLLPALADWSGAESGRAYLVDSAIDSLIKKRGP